MTYHNPPPSCLICCNVRTGALLKSFLILFGGFILITFSVLDRAGYFSDIGLSSENDYTRQLLELYSKSDRAFYLAILSGIFYVSVGAFAVVGIVKYRSRYLLPVLIVQIFDTISYLGALCSVLFLSNRYEAVIDQIGAYISEDFKNWILSLDPDWRFVTVVTYFTWVLLISMLFTKCIYQTYKHITLEEIAQQRRVREISVVGLPDEEERIEGPIYKLPRYEDLQKTPLVDNCEEDEYPTKPPAYEA